MFSSFWLIEWIRFQSRSQSTSDCLSIYYIISKQKPQQIRTFDFLPLSFTGWWNFFYLIFFFFNVLFLLIFKIFLNFLFFFLGKFFLSKQNQYNSNLQRKEMVRSFFYIWNFQNKKSCFRNSSKKFQTQIFLIFLLPFPLLALILEDIWDSGVTIVILRLGAHKETSKHYFMSVCTQCEIDLANRQESFFSRS